ncbi:MAG: FadR/GntR family transcriptional regulator [Exilibacterium sp.]
MHNRTSTNHNLTQQMTHDLGIAIIQGAFRPEQGLPSEAELCEQFNVSRSATREAVKMLTAKGLLSSRPRQGIRVLPENLWNVFDPDVLRWILNSRPSLELLREFTQMRLAIEPEAAALAAQSPDKSVWVPIAKAVERMRDAEQGLDDPLESDIDFHTSILLASHNRFMIQLRNFTETALRVSIRYTNRLKGVGVADVEDHAKIYEAIRKQRPKAAQNATRSVLSEAATLIEQALKEDKQAEVLAG